MVIGRADDSENVFDVFAARVRGRSRKSLVQQVVVCVLSTAVIMLAAPGWWPVAATIGGAAGYAAWGLLDRRSPSTANRVALRGFAAIATALVLIGVIGLGLLALTGDARSPYGTCYDTNGRAFACDARGQRRS